MSFSLSSLIGSLPGAVSQGLLWGVMALGVMMSYRILDFSDLTVDSSLCTGAAVNAVMLAAGLHPLLALAGATVAGLLAGLMTGLLHTVLDIPPILSGILSQLALYSINMRILGRANYPLLGVETLLSLREPPAAILKGSLAAVLLVLLLNWFFTTERGYAIRATGSNAGMARAQGINTASATVLTLMLSNALIGLSGGLISQYQGYADVNMGRGAIVIGLASIILGEALPGLKGRFPLRLVATVLGSILYYIVITLVLQMGLNTNDLKLLSALVVALALGVPVLRRKSALKRSIMAGMNQPETEENE
ncbi:MAG: ABC transporter permease [Clostridia bacterium]|nr:ABC transporter permease [Clostridia bacterium]